MSDTDRPRREFFRKIGRLAAGGLLAGEVGYLSVRTGEVCVNDYRCRECAALADCRLPQAFIHREHGMTHGPESRGESARRKDG